jgi:hypothetical protein
VFHGAGVILAGMLAGFPYALVLTGDLAGSERAWRMTHLEGVLNGLLLIGVAAVGSQLTLGRGQQRLLAWALILTAWGNIIASVLGATFGVRGLTPGGSVANSVVYVLFLAAVVGVLVALGLVLLGTRRRTVP